MPPQTLVMFTKMLLEKHRNAEVPRTIAAYSEEQLLVKLLLLDK